jgi:hypothetical protein
MSTKTVQETLNDASPALLASILQTLKGGDIVRALPVCLRKKDPAASSAQLATLEAVGVAENARASRINRAYARTGTGTCGELTIAAVNATPSAGEIAVAPNGDIVVLAADAWTSLDVEYSVSKGEVVELTLPVVSHNLTIPTYLTDRGVIYLISAYVNTGTTLGAKIILANSDSAPATTKALLKLDKTVVKFAVADAVTNATVRLLVAPASDIDAQLAATATAGL